MGREEYFRVRDEEVRIIPTLYMSQSNSCSVFFIFPQAEKEKERERERARERERERERRMGRMAEGEGGTPSRCEDDFESALY